MSEPERDIILITPGSTTMREIAEEVAAKYSLTLDDLKSQSRKRRIAHPRQEAFARIYALGRFSTTQIGRYFGGRDHTTVMHGLDAHEARLSKAQGEGE